MKLILKLFILLFSLQAVSQQPEITNCLSDTTNKTYYELNFHLDTSNIGTIQLISGGVGLKQRGKKISVSNFKFPFKKNYRLKHCKVNKPFRESYNTSENEKKVILNLLVNYYIPERITLGQSLLCYNPRNAIIIYDKKDKLYAILEICFECKNSILIIDNSKAITGICEGSHKKINDLFKTAGIKYGITKK